MDINWSDELLRIVELARGEALRTGWRGIGVDHMMLGLLRDGGNDAVRALVRLGIDPAELKSSIDSRIWQEESVPYAELDNIHLSENAKSLLNLAALEASLLGDTHVAALHLLLAFCRKADCSIHVALGNAGVTREAILSGRTCQPEGRTPSGPRARDIADAIEAELRRVMETSTINTEFKS